MPEHIARNPKWTRDEIILALHTYFQVNINTLSVHEDAIVQLSDLLRKLNAYENGSQSDTYRNPSGVHMKLMNFYSIETPGKGLQNASKLDRLIYHEYVEDKEHFDAIAKKIIETVDTGKKVDGSYEDEGFMEGTVLEKQHKYKERNRRAVKAKKEHVLRECGYLQCEVCGFIFNDVYGELGDGYIECHHIVPLAEINVAQETKLCDLALVCANCHRMLHRRRPWITIQALKQIVDGTVQN